MNKYIPMTVFQYPYKTEVFLAQSAGIVEYADCISAEW